jgi:hypothetical protein
VHPDGCCSVVLSGQAMACLSAWCQELKLLQHFVVITGEQITNRKHKVHIPTQSGALTWPPKVLVTALPA